MTKREAMRQTHQENILMGLGFTMAEAALYVLRPGDIPAGATADSCYSRGICVY